MGDDCSTITGGVGSVLQGLWASEILPFSPVGPLLDGEWLPLQTLSLWSHLESKLRAWFWRNYEIMVVEGPPAVHSVGFPANKEWKIEVSVVWWSFKAP